MKKIAVLITCYNRRLYTLKCLKRLFELTNDVDVYLVDDNSSDGTSDDVMSMYPDVNIIKGTGNLFWNRGMHLAWENASKSPYEYYLWLNDDVILYNNSIEELLYCSKMTNAEAIISGIISNHDNTEVIYGGSNSRKELIISNGEMNEIYAMNGNVVLVPKKVFDILGNIDPIYHHDLGDVDYGYRARNNKIGVFTTRYAIASGIKNDFCRVRFWGGSLSKRFRKLYSPLGNHPKINFLFRKKHYGIFNACIYYIHIHMINLLPDKLIKALFGNRYLNNN